MDISKLHLFFRYVYFFYPAYTSSQLSKLDYICCFISLSVNWLCTSLVDIEAGLNQSII